MYSLGLRFPLAMSFGFVIEITRLSNWCIEGTAVVVSSVAKLGWDCFDDWFVCSSRLSVEMSPFQKRSDSPILGFLIRHAVIFDFAHGVRHFGDKFESSLMVGGIGDKKESHHDICKGNDLSYALGILELLEAAIICTE